MTVARAVDAVLEASVVGSFTRLGYDARSRLEHWPPLEALRLDGRTAVVTGATSGLGREAAGLLAGQGAQVCVVGRDPQKTERTRASIAGATSELADLSSLARTRELADRIAATYAALDVLVLNAGAMTHDLTWTDEGHEVTFATHVLSQFLLVRELAPVLAAAAGRVIVVSSGGMYTVPLDVDALRPEPGTYDGVRAYALAKRAQVVLVEEWARRLAATGVTINAMHPGWSDTPGLRAGLPRFSAALAPFLRTPRQGADTIAWLAASPDAAALGGLFFLDRRPRAKHRLARTRRADTPQERARLWRLCQAATDSFSAREIVS